MGEPAGSDNRPARGSGCGWFLFLAVGYVIVMAAIPHRAITDGNHWKSGDCRMLRIHLGNAVALYNQENAVPITRMTASDTEILMKGKYIERVGAPDFIDVSEFECPGGWTPDPPTKWNLWWYDKQENLLSNGWVPLPLVFIFGGVRSADPGTFSITLTPKGVGINCSLHSSGAFVPFQKPGSWPAK